MMIKTRFAPSPTGYLHIGGVRTALFCWLYARRHGGHFVLRIEDTDRERSTQVAVDAILDGMAWLGLDPDEGPFYQSQRFDRYREVAARLLAEGKAYHCWCTREELDQMRAQQQARGERPGYDGRCRQRSEPRPGVTPVLRFRMPLEGDTVVDDQVRGRVVFDNREIDDLIILRGDGSPTYHFSVVVDDADMGITHVIRGDDHLNNTPRQIRMIEALGLPVPVYAHLPMILGPDGAKLSKRHGAVNVLEYREQGYLPEAVLNYLVRLGWAHGDQELFSIEEMTRLFDVTDVNASAARIDPDKLNWLNQQYIKAAPAARLAEGLRAQLAAREGCELAAGPPLEAVVEAFRERAVTLHEMAESAGFLYRSEFVLDEKAAAKHLKPALAPALQMLQQRLEGLADWRRETLHEALAAVAEACGLGFGKLGQPVRVAVTGGTVSPPIDVTLELVGRERVLARLAKALGRLL
ncbi:MAG: glutamate--tRNA ligase [Chromatiales bacterium]|nr:glutamate--tRNA ligase [Chromatiales bacterium]